MTGTRPYATGFGDKCDAGKIDRLTSFYFWLYDGHKALCYGCWELLIYFEIRMIDILFTICIISERER